MRDQHDEFVHRLRKLNLPFQTAGELQHHLALLHEAEFAGHEDALLREHIDAHISELEEEALVQPFLQPSDAGVLAAGPRHILDTPPGQPVCIGFIQSDQNPVTHVGVMGASGRGKSCLMAGLAVAAAPSCHTVIIDSVRFYRRVRAIRATHQFVRQQDLRWNLFQYPAGLPHQMGDQIVVGEICGSYSLIFGGYVFSEALRETRDLGLTPNLPGVIERLKKKRYQGFSKRSQYRDSAVLVLENLLNGTGELFRCARGMDLSRLLRNNVVIELEGLPEHQAFLTRYLFEYVRLMRMAELNA